MHQVHDENDGIYSCKKKLENLFKIIECWHKITVIED